LGDNTPRCHALDCAARDGREELDATTPRQDVGRGIADADPLLQQRNLQVEVWHCFSPAVRLALYAVLFDGIEHTCHVNQIRSTTAEFSNENMRNNESMKNPEPSTNFDT
jgi:hypothetical protein